MNEHTTRKARGDVRCPTCDWPGYDELRAENEQFSALTKEVAGCWRVFEVGLREVIGNTNYNVIARKLTALPPQRGAPWKT